MLLIKYHRLVPQQNHGSSLEVTAQKHPIAEPNEEEDNKEKRANRNWMWIEIVSQGGKVAGSGRISLAAGPRYT